MLLLGWQGNAGETEVTQGIVDLLALGLAQAGKFITLGQLGKSREQTGVLTDKGLVFGEQRQATIVSRPQFVTVDHRVHMGDRRPDAT